MHWNRNRAPDFRAMAHFHGQAVAHQHEHGEDRGLCAGQRMVADEGGEHDDPGVDVVDQGRCPDQPHLRREAHQGHDRFERPGQVADQPQLLEDLDPDDDGDHDLEEFHGRGEGVLEEAGQYV